ncbi:MAG: hypothetical protein M1814_006694 [Vezdaea aestivalis]|nr:MAG: hypothetical protein M1814_006694 [Vezdaea aestivalis]
MALLHMGPERSTTNEDEPTSSSRSSLFSARSRKQFSLFLAGTTFFGLSMLMTKRALVRRRRSAIPKFYFPSNDPHLKFNGAIDAFEALTIASMNVASLSVMMVGGVLWGLDVSNMDDLRRKVRGGLGVDGTGRGEKDVEEEFEEWLATTLARKERKEAEGQKARPRTADGRER